MPPNGPAIKCRLCYPTQAPGSVQVPRGSGARKLSRCKEGMARFLPSGYKVLWALRVSRYKAFGEQVASQGILSFKRAKAQSRYKVIGPVIRSRSKGKNRDKQMHFIVRVIVRFVFYFLSR
jgi:hypothetical protein